MSFEIVEMTVLSVIAIKAIRPKSMKRISEDLEVEQISFCIINRKKHGMTCRHRGRWENGEQEDSKR